MKFNHMEATVMEALGKKLKLYKLEFKFLFIIQTRKKFFISTVILFSEIPGV